MSSEKSMKSDTNHISRIFWITFVLSVAADLLFWFLVGPHVPPGRMTSSASDDQFDFNILMVIALPVLIGVWVYFAYAFATWNSKGGKAPEPVGGPAARSNNKASFLFIAISTVIVLFLAGFGTVELIVGNGSGGGEGPNPVWEPAGAAKAETAALTSSDSWTPGTNHVLVVQVIAQQWKFTYRYPQFGDFESQDLILPDHTTIAFNVTSLDVIHDFWAYQLEVKADANPQENNVAFTTTNRWAVSPFVAMSSAVSGMVRCTTTARSSRQVRSKIGRPPLKALTRRIQRTCRRSRGRTCQMQMARREASTPTAT
jgi:cytochrome c oxidase subunit 2